MIEEIGDLWDKHAEGYWIGITINGFIKSNNRLVMGRGIAKEALDRYPDIDLILADIIKRRGLGVVNLYPERLWFFPVKHNWWEQADIKLIEASARELRQIKDYINELQKKAEASSRYTDRVYLPRLGCGNGRLKWEDVKPVLEPYFDDRFIIMTNENV